MTTTEERHVLIEAEKANESVAKLLDVLGLGGGGIDMPKPKNEVIEQILWRLNLLQEQLIIVHGQINKL